MITPFKPIKPKPSKDLIPYNNMRPDNLMFQSGGSFIQQLADNARTQIAKKGMPKIKVDEFGIARDQYGNLYQKDHGTSEYRIDNNKSGYWGHVASAQSGWNESDYKDQEIAKLKGNKGVFPMLGALLRTPENALNATLSGNYEPWSVSRRRLTDPNFDPNSGTGIAMDIFGDPAVLKSLAEIGIKKIPALAEFTKKAGIYLANKAQIAARFAAKYGKVALNNMNKLGVKGIHAMGWALEHSAPVVEFASGFKSVLGHAESRQTSNKEQNKSINPQNVLTPQRTPAPQGVSNPQRVNSPQVQKTIQSQAQQVYSQPTVTGIDTNTVVRDFKHPDYSSGQVYTPQTLSVKSGDKNSIVDLLRSNNIDPSFQNRRKLANNLGMDDYSGTASQNLQLKKMLEMNKFQKGGYKQNGYDAIDPRMYGEMQQMKDNNFQVYPTQEEIAFKMLQERNKEYYDRANQNLNMGERMLPKQMFDYLKKSNNSKVRSLTDPIYMMKNQYQQGGMQEQPQEEQMEQPGQEQGQEQQIMQMVAQALQQGAQPEEIMQMLVQQGIPQEQAQMIIQEVMSQMQGGQQQPPQQGPQGMPMQQMGGMRPRGLSFDY